MELVVFTDRSMPVVEQPVRQVIASWSTVVGNMADWNLRFICVEKNGGLKSEPHGYSPF